MADERWTCPGCGTSVDATEPRCPNCGTPSPSPTPAETAPVEPPTGAPDPPDDRSPPESGEPSELATRIGRLGRWSAAARQAGAELPRLPAWAERAAAASDHPDVWNDALRQLEHDVRRQAAGAFDRLRDRIAPRIARLEAYGVDAHDERERLAEAARAAKRGDLAEALVIFRQLDAVVALQERHLEQVRDDLERFLTMVRDLEAIGVPLAVGSDALAPELEADLRAGRLAALRQRIRSARTAAAEALRAELPGYVARVGDRLAVERQGGLASDAEVRDLAEGARYVMLGQTEEGVRLLRRVGAPRGIRRPAASGNPASSG